MFQVSNSKIYTVIDKKKEKLIERAKNRLTQTLMHLLTAQI
jgi:hypothetical protein